MLNLERLKSVLEKCLSRHSLGRHGIALDITETIMICSHSCLHFEN